MRYVTFYYDLMNERVSALKVHQTKESALKYFNQHCHGFFKINTKFKADKLPATYGYPLRKYCGVSAIAFRKMFEIGIDEALKLAESEER